MNPDAVQRTAPPGYAPSSGAAPLGRLILTFCDQVVLGNSTTLEDVAHASIRFPVDVPADVDNGAGNLFVAEWLATPALAKQFQSVDLPVVAAEISTLKGQHGHRVTVLGGNASYTVELVRYEADSGTPFSSRGRVHVVDTTGAVPWADAEFDGTQAMLHSLASLDASSGALRDLQRGADGHSVGSAALNEGTETLTASPAGK